jgi:phospholipid transport system substrate-binding protein
MKPLRHACLVLASALALVLLTGRGATAGPPTDQLRESIDRALKALEDPELRKEIRTRERRAALRGIANETFDFEEMTKRALARHWHGRTPAEQKEFVQLFADLLERSYASKIELYGGEKISYVGESVEGELATVRTKIVTKQDTAVPVDYRMHRRGDRWLVYDVVIEGISLVANYRSQFNAIIQTSTYQGLVARMKTKAVSVAERATEKGTALEP